MPRNETFVDDTVYDKLSYLSYTRSGSTSSAEKTKMKRFLHKAIDAELSYMQRYCLLEHYINGRKMKDIAKTLSLNPSTVTRHIKKAKEKLQHIASYY